MTPACAVTLTETVDLDELARVYRKVHAADLHLDGQVAGAVLGCPLPPDTLWWRDLVPFPGWRPHRMLVRALRETR